MCLLCSIPSFLPSFLFYFRICLKLTFVAVALKEDKITANFARALMLKSFRLQWVAGYLFLAILDWQRRASHSQLINPSLSHRLGNQSQGGTLSTPQRNEVTSAGMRAAFLACISPSCVMMKNYYNKYQPPKLGSGLFPRLKLQVFLLNKEHFSLRPNIALSILVFQLLVAFHFLLVSHCQYYPTCSDVADSCI